MSDDQQVLSNAEVGALLEGVVEGAVATSDGVRTDGEIRAYEFNSNSHVSSYCPASLVNLYSKLCRKIRTGLYELLRQDVTVELESLRRHRYDEYRATLSEPTCVNAFGGRGLPGAGLVVIDAALVSGLVDLYYGGGGNPAAPAGRALTPVEMRMSASFVDLALGQLTQVWSSVDDISFTAISVETSPKLVTVAAPSESMLVAKIRIQLAEMQSEFHLVVPLQMLAPVRAKLAASGQGSLAVRDRFLASVREQLRDISVDLVGSLCEIPLTLRDVVALAPGDVMPVDLPEHLVLCVDEAPVLQGRFGKSRGANAVCVQELGGDDKSDSTTNGTQP